MMPRGETWMRMTCRGGGRRPRPVEDPLDSLKQLLHPLLVLA